MMLLRLLALRRWDSKRIVTPFQLAGPRSEGLVVREFSVGWLRLSIGFGVHLRALAMVARMGRDFSRDLREDHLDFGGERLVHAVFFHLLP